MRFWGRKSYLVEQRTMSQQWFSKYSTWTSTSAPRIPQICRFWASFRPPELKLYKECQRPEQVCVLSRFWSWKGLQPHGLQSAGFPSMHFPGMNTGSGLPVSSRDTPPGLIWSIHCGLFAGDFTCWAIGERPIYDLSIKDKQRLTLLKKRTDFIQLLTVGGKEQRSIPFCVQRWQHFLKEEGGGGGGSQRQERENYKGLASVNAIRLAVSAHWQLLKSALYPPQFLTETEASAQP